MRAGVLLRRAALGAADVVQRRRLPVTSPLRTVFDLARRLPLVEAVVAVDLALHAKLVGRDGLSAYTDAHAGARGITRARRVIDLAEADAESPMESRLRMVLVLARLPRPAVQVPLFNDRGDFVGRPDLFYPAQRLGLEYDGGNHRTNLEDDNRRQNRLLNAGYRLLRFTADDVYNKPRTVVAQVRAELGSGR